MKPAPFFRALDSRPGRPGRSASTTTVLTDSMAGALMRSGARSNLVIVGADRVAANGDVANKIGTYGVAVLAHGTTGFPSTWRFPGAPSIRRPREGRTSPSRREIPGR